jgi:predicted acyl esterase
MRLLLAVLVLLVTAAPAAAQTPEEVRVPMRDGVELALDVYKASGVEKAPVILTLTPYHALYKGLGGGSNSPAWALLQEGYTIVLADVRGTYESGGCWDYGGQKEREDGYDLVEWLGTQPWSNGKVAMIGASYDGTTANAAAVENPPHLATIVPISSISRWYGYAYTQGVRHSYSGESDDIDPPSDTPLDFQFAYGFAPPPEPGAVTSAQQVAMRWNPCDRVEQLLHGYSTEPDYDDFWKARDYLKDAARVTTPVLVTHGYQDYNVKTWEGTQWYEALPGEKAMIIGQWGHAIPVWDEWPDYLLRWMGRWLMNEPNGIESEAPVVSQSSDGEFRRRTRFTGTGRTTAKLGEADMDIFDDGTLTESEMLRDTCRLGCVHLKLAGLEGRQIVGRPRISLRATSDQPSTHFVAVLLERTASGEAKVISRGFMNARYRKTLEKGEDVEPGVPQTYEIELIDKDNMVAADSTVELLLASSSITWVVSDENRANNTLHLAESSIEIPIDGPEPPAQLPPATVVNPPEPHTSAPATPAPCKKRRRVTFKLPKKARRGKLRVTVNGRRAKARRHGKKLVVTLPRTRTGRAVVRVTKKRRAVLTRRVKTCR